MDEFANLGRLALGSRLKRISDYMFSEVNAFYKENGIEFEASTFPLLRVVHKYGPLSLREAEHKLGITHAAISQKAKVLHKHGLISMRTDRNDQRSKLLRLTEKGEKLVVIARPCWEAMDRAVAHMLYPEEQQLFRALRHFEEQTARKPLRSYIYEHFAPKPLQNVRITGYGVGMKPHFRRLNEEWLDKQFSIEPIDEELFDNPRQAIIDKGGDILFAEYEGQIVGTCALLKSGDAFELAKMGVDPRYRGRGLGKILLSAAIDKARELGAHRIYLLSSTNLPAALALYKSLGFEETPVTEDDIAKYGRVDVRMEKKLD